MNEPNQKMLAAVVAFVDAFETVFGENDWVHTKEVIKHQDRYIQGTFIQPGVADEYNDWENRGRLLAAYRCLKSLLPKT